MSIHALRPSFNGGEISPLMDGRVDADKYSSSCRILQNFIPKIYGGAFRRPGTVYKGSAADHTNPVKLFPFNFSASTRFVIEIGSQSIQIWGEGSQPVNVFGSSPWVGAHVKDIQMVQLNDICFFTHPFYPVQELVRRSNDDWAIAPVSWTYPALGDINLTDITAKVYHDGSSDPNSYLFEFENFDENVDYPFLFDVSTRTALSPSYVNADRWEGVHIEIIHRREESYVEIDMTSSGTSPELRVLGDVELFSYGTWSGTLYFERKLADGTFEVIRDFKGDSDRNVVYKYTEETEETFRLRWDRTDSTGTPRAILEAADSRVKGLVKVVERQSISLAKVELINPPLNSNATLDWTMEAWNGVWGYPATIAFHEQRLLFAGTNRQPTTLFASQSGDFKNFRRSTYDSGGFAFTLAATEASPIRSILSHENLLLFTDTEEWSLSTYENSAITPTNPYVRRHSRYGSAFQQAMLAGQSIVFLQRGRRKLREYGYSQTQNVSVAIDLTLLSEHVSQGGITQFAFQQHPDPIIWCVTANGDLLSMTYESQQNVTAWSRHTTEGEVESVAVTYGDGDNGDEVWLAVKRTADDQTYRYIEKFDPSYATKLLDESVESMVYADSAKVISSEEPFNSIADLSHLEGNTVTILADGSMHPDRVVKDGRLILDRYVTKAVVGLPFVSILQPSKIELQMDSGTSQGRNFSQSRVVLNLWKSAGIEYASYNSEREKDWQEVKDISITTPLDGQTPLTTDEIEVVDMSGFNDSIDFTIRQKKPLPANILSMVHKLSVEGD